MDDGSYSTAVVVTTDHDIALRDELLNAGKAYRAEARAERTRKSYARAWHSFEVWCAAHDAASLPASPETIAAWLTAMATGIGNRKPLSRSAINQAMSAVHLAHRTAGHPFDRKHPIITETWRGISRSKAEQDTERQAAALVDSDLQAIIAALSTIKTIDVRDRALLLLGLADAGLHRDRGVPCVFDYAADADKLGSWDRGRQSDEARDGDSDLPLKRR